MKYILGFVFDSSLKNVLLIHKNRPDWQKNKLNGVGGHLEVGETPEEGISREVLEETGLQIDKTKFIQIATMEGDNWKVFVFGTVYAGKQSEAESITDEYIEWFSVKKIPANVITNLNWLIPLCLDKITTKSPNSVNIFY